MNFAAIALMLFSMIVIWGGLIASSIFLVSRPELEEGEYPPVPSDK